MAKIKTSPRHRGYDHPFKPKKISSRSFNQVYWPYLPVILVIGLLLSMGMAQGDFQNVIKNPGGSVLSYATSMQDQLLLADTNAQRSTQQLPVLAINPRLDAAADAKARDMAQRNYWSHNTPDGQEPWVFVTGQKYNYQKLGENLAAGFSDEQSAVKGWMASQSHRDNLLDPTFKEVGFGVAQVSNYSAAGGGPMTVVVAFYGEPAAGGPVVSTVSGDTDSSNVSLAQLALAKLPVVGLVTNLVMALAVAALAIWLGRHIRIIKRALKKGEKYAFSHPFLDAGLITIAALSYLLSRTAGLIH